MGEIINWTSAVRSMLVMCFIIAVFGAAPFGSAFAAGTTTDITGTWEGTLGVLYEPGNVPKSPETFTLRIEISELSVRVFLKQDDKWIDAKPGAFRVQRYRSNAIMAAMDSGNDEDGVWVETWNITVAPKGNDTLLAIYARLVTNEDLPVTSEHKTFGVAGKGELHRVKR